MLTEQVGYPVYSDSLAADLITRFSDDTLDTTKAPGAPGIFTDAGGTLNSANLPGVAGRLRLNSAVDPAQGGDIARFRDGVGANTTGPTGEASLINGYLDALGASNSAPIDSGFTGNFS